ncbi:PxKF domain-containing protein [Knoellia sp. CPCC 206435]|uniref:PxKF domain-containing protein n=1 Tax=Knoellia terrae TaxID=3404797 RepID=UPI003B43A281
MKNDASLTVNVVSSDATKATVFPSSLTFTDCGTPQSITVTPVSAGYSRVTLTVATNNSTGTFNLAPATFDVVIAPGAQTNTAPTVTVTGVTDGASYEHGSVPAATCAADDAEDGSSTPPVSLTEITGPLAAYGLGSQTATCSYTDKGGLIATSSATYSIVDTTAPTISAVISPVRPDSGWWNVTSGAPTVTYTCGDTASGIADCPAPHTFIEGEDQLHEGTAYDRAGNSAKGGVSDVDVDLTGPGVTWLGGPAAGASYYFGSVPAAGTCEASDALSGPDGCAVTGYGTTVGAHTLSATAKDKAANSTTEQRDYTVLAWTLRGFFQPVDMGGVLNTVKGGSTVPLKFEVFAGNTELTDPAVVEAFSVKQVNCGTSTVTDDVELVTTGATSLRYDATGGQFIQNWQTPKNAGACYTVTMKTDDGSAISANFKLK